MPCFTKAKDSAKHLHKGVWIAAAIIPFGIVALTTYLAVKSYLDNKKDEND